MAHNGIYVTPNQVVANKNRKTKFEELSEEIANANEIITNVNNKVAKLLKEYSEDISEKYYDDWQILNIEYDNTGLTIDLMDYWKDSIKRYIPNDWINNRSKYCANLKATLRKERIENLKKSILNHQKKINEDNWKITNMQKELQELQDSEILETLESGEL